MLKNEIFLERKLECISHIVGSSWGRAQKQRKAWSTGYVMFFPEVLSWLAIKTRELLPEKARVLDLGCGNGAATLMFAAAGFRSYGIDCNRFLIEQHARPNYKAAVSEELIDRDVECRFAIGNIHHGEWYERYVEFVYSGMTKDREKNTDRKRHLPLAAGIQDPYAALGISLKEADLVYCYNWPEHMPFLCKFLSKTTNKDAHFILPWYKEKYSSLLTLVPCTTLSYDSAFIGPQALVSIYARRA